MTRPPDPQRRRSITERGGQTRDISQVSQQPSAGMRDDTPPVSSRNDLRTLPGSCI